MILNRWLSVGLLEKVAFVNRHRRSGSELVDKQGAFQAEGTVGTKAPKPVHKEQVPGQ